jgi:rubrerythrin
MSSDRKELGKFFEEQIKLEEEVAESLNRALEGLKNPVVNGVLKGISLDSKKHAEIYQAAKQIAATTPAVTEEELDHLKRTVKKHIVYEEKMMKQLSPIIKKTRNEKLKFLLESILSDEKRHHELLNKIMEIVVRGETITEGDWWEFLWQNVPFHGAPGG